MKLRLLALALLVCGGAAAQNPYIALQGADETSGGIVVSQPRTVLAVDVTAERDVTLSGPYARYAQKFLGVRAPLTDKMSWAVTGASVALLDPKACLDAPAPAQPSRTVMSHATSEDEFSRLQADKNDMAVLALDALIRKHVEQAGRLTELPPMAPAVAHAWQPEYKRISYESFI